MLKEIFWFVCTECKQNHKGLLLKRIEDFENETITNVYKCTITGKITEITSKAQI